MNADIGAIVLDIEGTTTPIAFVTDVLFPFARRRLRAYLLEPKNRQALREPLRRLREERKADAVHGPSEGGHPADPESAHPEHLNQAPVQTEPSDGAPGFAAPAGLDEDLEPVATYVVWLMDQDRKSPGLKLLQGQMWEEGYRSGELKGEVFADVPPALRRWHDAGVAVAIYSSGSELAQRLLFGSTASGDLTPLVARFFDTTVGAKQATESYQRIAFQLGIPPERMLFISDVTIELDAAHSAGCEVLLCVRSGNRLQPDHTYRVIDTFEDVEQVARFEVSVERP